MELCRLDFTRVRSVWPDRFDGSSHCQHERCQQLLRRVEQEQTHDVVLHLRERVGKIHPVGMVTGLVEAIGNGLRHPREDRGEVEHKDFGVEVLLDDLCAQAREVLDLHAAFLALVAFFHTPAQMVEVLEPTGWISTPIERFVNIRINGELH